MAALPAPPPSLAKFGERATVAPRGWGFELSGARQLGKRPILPRGTNSKVRKTLDITTADPSIRAIYSIITFIGNAAHMAVAVSPAQASLPLWRR